MLSSLLNHPAFISRVALPWLQQEHIRDAEEILQLALSGLCTLCSSVSVTLPLLGGQSCDTDDDGQSFPPCQPVSSWASGTARTNLSLGITFLLCTDPLLPLQQRPCACLGTGAKRNAETTWGEERQVTCFHVHRQGSVHLVCFMVWLHQEAWI